MTLFAQYTALKEQQSFMQTLSASERNSIDDYTKGWAKLLNSNLCRSKKLNDKCSTISKNLDIMFTNVPPLDHPLVVYRGYINNQWAEQPYKSKAVAFLRSQHIFCFFMTLSEIPTNGDNQQNSSDVHRIV